jgi:hypothetical protein
VAEPEDVAKAYVALMERDYVTGNVSIVDGGSLLKQDTCAGGWSDILLSQGSSARRK